MPVPRASDPAAATALDPPTPLVPPRLSDRVLALVDQHRRWVFLGILALYAAGFNAEWRLEADSALYLSIGRNFAEGLGYTYHGKFHRLAYPGVPLMFAGLFKAFGTGTVLPHLVLMWLMGLATLGLVYRLFLLHAGRPTAVLITFGVAISRVFYRYTFELLSDLPFLLGVMAFFVGYEALFYRRADRADAGATVDPPRHESDAESRSAAPAVWFDGFLLIAGLALAVTTRPAMWALVLAAGLAMLWSLVRGRARWGHIAVAGMVALAVSLFYLKDPRHQPTDPNAPVSTHYVEEDQLFHLHAGRLATMARTAARNLPGVLEGPLQKATFGTALIPGLNAVLAAVITVAGVLLVRTRPLWGMWVLATLAMVLLVPKAVDRYFLPVVPILVFAWWTCTRWAERQFTGRSATAVFLLLFGLGGVTNTVATLGFVFEQRRVPFLAHYKEGRYASAYDVARMLEQHTPPSGATLDARTTWVAVPEKFARILTFLSRRYCTEPDAGTQIDPRRQTVYVLNPTEPAVPDAESRRPPTPAWLRERGTGMVPEPIASIPNKNPSDPRRWTLHRTAPLEVLGTQPMTAPVSATVPGDGQMVAQLPGRTHGSAMGVRTGRTDGSGRTDEALETRRTTPTPTALPWVPRAGGAIPSNTVPSVEPAR